MSNELTSSAFMEFALCKGNINVDFHSIEATQIRKAIAYCKQCPVQEACLSYSIQNKILFGVWGGYSAPDRIRMMRSISH